MAVESGKRLQDEKSGIELLVIRKGDCELKVDGREMSLVTPTVLPSAD